MAKVTFRRNKEQKPLTKEEKTSLIIRLVIFIVLLAGGITSIAFGIKACTTKSPGYYTIEGRYDENVPDYDAGNIAVTFYFDSDVDIKYREVTSIYSESLKTSYASTSILAHYNGYSSMYDINNAPYGEEVELSPFLYQNLKKAYQYSLDYDNYSIFNAPIYDYWNYLFSLDDSNAITLDPANNDDSKAYLEDLVAIINDDTNYSLTFNDEKLTVTLDISSEYEDFIDNRYKYHETNLPIISFNVLEDAIKVNYLSSSLKEAGYTKGYIRTIDGYATSIGGLENISYLLYDYVDDISYRSLGRVAFPGSSVGSTFRRFDINSRYFSPFYSFIKNDEEIHRSSYINNETGYPVDYFATSAVYGETLDIIKATLLNNELVLADNLEKTKAFIEKEEFIGYELAFTCFKEEKTIYLTQNLKDFITFNSDLDYNLIEL